MQNSKRILMCQKSPPTCPLWDKTCQVFTWKVLCCTPASFFTQFSIQSFLGTISTSFIQLQTNKFQGLFKEFSRTNYDFLRKKKLKLHSENVQFLNLLISPIGLVKIRNLISGHILAKKTKNHSLGHNDMHFCIYTR